MKTTSAEVVCSRCVPTSCKIMKAEVLAYLENVETRKEAKSGAVPIDVDSLARGKRKGRQDKGKGKEVQR